MARYNWLDDEEKPYDSVYNRLGEANPMSPVTEITSQMPQYRGAAPEGYEGPDMGIEAFLARGGAEERGVFPTAQPLSAAPVREDFVGSRPTMPQAPMLNSRPELSTSERIAMALGAFGAGMQGIADPTAAYLKERGDRFDRSDKNVQQDFANKMSLYNQERSNRTEDRAESREDRADAKEAREVAAMADVEDLISNPLTMSGPLGPDGQPTRVPDVEGYKKRLALARLRLGSKDKALEALEGKGGLSEDELVAFGVPREQAKTLAKRKFEEHISVLTVLRQQESAKKAEENRVRDDDRSVKKDAEQRQYQQERLGIARQNAANRPERQPRAKTELELWGIVANGDQTAPETIAAKKQLEERRVGRMSPEDRMVEDMNNRRNAKRNPGAATGAPTGDIEMTAPDGTKHKVAPAKVEEAKRRGLKLK